VPGVVAALLRCNSEPTSFLWLCVLARLWWPDVSRLKLEVSSFEEMNRVMFTDLHEMKLGQV
jgi:hypothetical protein